MSCLYLELSPYCRCQNARYWPENRPQTPTPKASHLISQCGKQDKVT